ncbi:MAG: hypothetical protein K0B85_09115 [Coriobacteriia bacterium]|nr:hypothetical protein [Coriobacteriia bacterium]
MSRQRLTLVRLTHDVVYVVMATATVPVLYAGLSEPMGPWLSVALALIAAEVAVFVGFGMKCPLAIVAKRYGAETGHAFEATLSPRTSRVAFLAVDAIGAAGLTLLAARWIGPLG